MKQAVILAGGKGTRLQERLGGLPKPLVDVAGVPLLERQIGAIQKYGYTNLLILVNYQAEFIERFFQQEKFKSLNISIIDDGEPLGTAGATLKILNQLQGQVLIVYGDTIFDIDLSRFESYHQRDLNIAATLFLHPNDHPADSDLVQLDQSGYITQFHAYPHPPDALFPNLVNAALYLINTSHFKRFETFQAPCDFAKNLFPAMLADGEKFLGYSSPEYIKDAGTPERLDRVIDAVKTGLVERSNLMHTQSAVFIDRDGTLNEEIGAYITSPDLLDTYDGIGTSLKRLKDSGWRTVLVTNQPVIARGDCSFAMLDAIHAKLESEVAKSKAFFDKIYVCPHHPDKGFEGEIEYLKVECLCRKPAPGMFLMAKSELNIDLRSSWHIGDSTADLGAAINAGATSITVETGHGGLDAKYSFQPQFSEPTFSDAVHFILTTYPRLVEKLDPLIQFVPQSNHWFIGGLSRSGKSTVANTIKRELRIRDIQCHVISLDRWLLAEKDRGAGVWERYDWMGILMTFKKINALGPDQVITLNLPNYSKIHKRPLVSPECVKISGGDVVLWEGVIANKIASKLGLEFSIYIEVEEVKRRQRIMREYLRRGHSPAEIDLLVSQREADEHSWVIAQKKYVNNIIVL
ncbi:HAD-IIIA family hydrolase [Polynucleobacter sp. AP-Elch-400A-B2]|uniref:HAD-IIIA family hydrolase n=1 Tax=Polynucleobacter sp. AP-Elch-400A-B2 TaxID=2576930 RepID=UPI001BFE982C|nr:HAD-IIIA family hydrolase [Polynucleobacter sp. AP-Elch-400A-B2]QWE25003.1 HAD-IIIA family hydrolase [Polynucleobacter sp. AP-Elch-400A-B2]